jgi:prepilin-type N-terminal cleavage/methylation domain-containing protein
MEGFGTGAFAMPGRAFTLIEILIVVLLLGVLAAIAIPQFADASEESQRATFVSNLGYFSRQCEYYRIQKGEYPPDGTSGELPVELDTYIRAEDFERMTPIGGVWDTELDDNGVHAAVGVHFNGVGNTQDDAYMTIIDVMLDDGDLADGLFRKLDVDRYYYVLEEAP